MRLKFKIFASQIAVILLLVLSLLSSVTALAGTSEMDGMVKFFFDNGKKAFQERHYSDAYGWFERAKMAVEREKGDDKVLGAICKEWMGRSCFAQGQVQKAQGFFTEAKMDLMFANGLVMNATTARLDDLLSETHNRLGERDEEERSLLSALNEALGENSRSVAEPDTVPYRTERLAQFCRKYGGLSTNAQYSSAINVGRTADDMYARSIETMSEKDRRNGGQKGVRESISKVFQLWKNQNDNIANAYSKSKYETCWARVYGASPGATITPVSPAPGWGIVPSTGWSIGTSGGITIQPGAGGLLNGTPGFNTGFRNPFGKTGGASTLPLPNTSSPRIYKSPWDRNVLANPQQARVFDSGEKESLNAMDETVKNLLGK